MATTVTLDQSLAQAASGVSSFTTSYTSTFNIRTNNELIVLGIGLYGSPAITVSSVMDSGSLTWTQQGALDYGNYRTEIWTAPQPTATGESKFTVNASGTGTIAITAASFYLTGIPSSIPTVSAINIVNVAGGATQKGDVTTVLSNDQVLAFISLLSTGANPGAGTGYSLISGGNLFFAPTVGAELATANTPTPSLVYTPGVWSGSTNAQVASIALNGVAPRRRFSRSSVI
jgi:hypothetical protein